MSMTYLTSQKCCKFDVSVVRSGLKTLVPQGFLRHRLHGREEQDVADAVGMRGFQPLERGILSPFFIFSPGILNPGSPVLPLSYGNFAVSFDVNCRKVIDDSVAAYQGSQIHSFSILSSHPHRCSVWLIHPHAPAHPE